MGTGKTAFIFKAFSVLVSSGENPSRSAEPDAYRPARFGSLNSLSVATTYEVCRLLPHATLVSAANLASILGISMASTRKPECFGLQH